MPTTSLVSIRAAEWTIYTDDVLYDKIHAFRADRLPNETGGVLLGHFDPERRIVYVMDALSSPPDSKEWPTVYIRGAVGLRERVEAVQERTGTILQYVGEWHSHPDGYSCRTSSDDEKAFAWLTRLMAPEDYPGIMLIEGEHGRTWCLERME